MISKNHESILISSFDYLATDDSLLNVEEDWTSNLDRLS